VSRALIKAAARWWRRRTFERVDWAVQSAFAPKVKPSGSIAIAIGIESRPRAAPGVGPAFRKPLPAIRTVD